jgi:acyl carrier protein
LVHDQQSGVDVLERVNDVFRDVFDDESLSVRPETTAADVEGWDSLMHVRLIIAIEKAFRVRFSSSEVASLKDVGDLIGLLQTKAPASQAQ